MALPKAHRLRRRQDFSAVYKNGARRKSSHLTLIVLPQTQSKLLDRSSREGKPCLPLEQVPTRVGISISQKVSKRAVVRNRIKRQIRSVFRHLLPQFPWGWTLVVVVQPQAIQCDYLQFLQELEQLLTDAEVLNGHS